MVEIDNTTGVVNANAATFPILATVDMTVAYLNLGPCAMLPPHYHPRRSPFLLHLSLVRTDQSYVGATNLVVAIEGSTTTYMVEENSARTITTTLTPGKMTIFPTASLHSMQNNRKSSAHFRSFQPSTNIAYLSLHQLHPDLDSQLR